MKHNTILDIISLCYHPFLLIFILYVACVTGFAREEQKQSAFFQLYSAILCSEFLHIVSKDILLAEELLTVFRNFPIIILFACNLTFATFSGMAIGYTVIAFNRFTAVMMPTLYDKIWSKRHLKWMVGAQQILPLIVFIPVYFAEPLYNGNLFTGVTPAIAAPARWTVCGLLAFSALVCLPLNAVTFYKINKAKFKSDSEGRLLKITLLTFTMHCVLTLVNGWRATTIFSTDVFQKKLAQKVVFIITDINALVTCASMFLANSRLRTLFGLKKLLARKSNSKGSNTVGSTKQVFAARRYQRN